MKKSWLIWLLVVLMFDTWFAYWWWHRWKESRFDSQIIAAGKKYGVPPTLIKAVVWKESSFNPTAQGRAQEIGLMQIRMAAASEWAAAQRIPTFQQQSLYDPGTNVLVGTWYLKKLLKRYAATDQPAVYALADYNAGRSHVLRWKYGAAATNSNEFLTQMDFPNTKKYLKDILKRERHYAGL